MSKTILVTKLPELAEIKRVYSGKPGCACGCNGTYYVPVETNYSKNHLETVSPNMVKKVYNIFKSQLANNGVYTWENKDGTAPTCFVHDKSIQRTYTMYTTD